MESGREVSPLLRYGIVAGPLYLAVGIAQALVREGFDPARHPLSLLANGTGGWIQTANFVVVGAMVIAASVGIRRVLAPEGRVAGWLLAAFGGAMLLAAVFPADPVDGFPVGTPEGPPTSISTRGMLHFVFGMLGFVALAAGCLLMSRALGRSGMRSLSRLSLFSGLAVVGGFLAGPLIGHPTAGIWFAVVAGWLWLSVLSWRLGGEAAERSRS